jgi:hypothetical protein
MFASILGGLTYSLSLHGPTLEVYGPNQEQKWQHAAFALVITEKDCCQVSSSNQCRSFSWMLRRTGKSY